MEIIVVVANSNNTKVELYGFVNEEDAKKYIKERYVNEIRKAPYYDYENTYIDKSFKRAVVSAGVYSVKFTMCCHMSRNYNKRRDKGICYRKARRKKIRM